MMVVVFTSNNARVFYTETPDVFKGYSYVVNPDLRDVVGVPPHFWKLVRGNILPMNKDEREARLKHHEANGVDNLVNILVAQKSIAEPIESMFKRIVNKIFLFFRKIYGYVFKTT